MTEEIEGYVYQDVLMGNVFINRAIIEKDAFTKAYQEHLDSCKREVLSRLSKPSQIIESDKKTSYTD